MCSQWQYNQELSSDLRGREYGYAEGRKMPARLAAGERLEVGRGSVVVCIPVGTADDSPAACERIAATLQSVVERTDPSTPLLIAGPAARVERAIESAPFGVRGQLNDLNVLELAPKTSETAAVNAAMDASVPGDVALVAAGVEVTHDWLPRLRAAALSDSTVASATPLSLGVGGVDLLADPELLSAAQIGPADASTSISELARRVSGRSRRLWPRTATAGPGCVYIRRSTLELTGSLEEALPLDEALLDLATNSMAGGMVHVAADDVLVTGRRTTAVQERAGGAGVAEAVGETIAEDERGCLRRAMDVARAALRPLSVTIDARSLTETVGGTQTYILELIAALAREDAISLRVLVPHDLSERARNVLSGPSIELVSYEQAAKGVPLSDVVHRPQQAFTPEDMTLLKLVGRRIVIGQQDLIAYHNHSYHPDIDRWRAYRRTTRLALTAADQVIFFSEHARRDALAEDLLPGARTHVVGAGADAFGQTSSGEARPDGVPADHQFLLCIGADYAHKNRPFAIELTWALNELGWAGSLVLAGSHVAHGSSREHERELLQRRPDLAERVIDLGAVDEPGRRWLYRHARALVYPTLYEGLGLVPLEAAREGLPCLFASQASLAELAGQAATLVPWDPRASASAILPLLTDGPERERHLAQLRELAPPSWEDTARRLVEVYERAIAEPPSEGADRVWQALDRESCIVSLDQEVQHLRAKAQEYHDAYHSLDARVAGGLPLIDEGGLLTPAEQRGLMRIASRRLLRGPILGPIGLLGRREA
jgi:glycosyltransferase involved in cell wall biosynthesis